MRVLVDEQLPPALARWIAERGFVAEHVSEIGLSGCSDREVVLHAARTYAVIFTKDEDFASGLYGGPVQVVWLRVGNVRNRVLLERMDALWPELLARLASGDRMIESR